MAYTVFARKYRPQRFEELVGQEHIARTLANAIQADRVAHAFLFTGVRGVGKTTMARLLAKALNCEQGPTPTPCNVCDACKEITTGVDVDVLEIDGASHNGVDDVRRLQETLPFRPARDRFKVVIVDEVHMLSTGAFNAFLKTLEEPPDHVKFIFATTEAHKVPITIRSRCQQYDFRLIPQNLIAEQVRAILRSEEVQADEATIAIVAREAAGSLRDALTILDQLVANSGGTLEGTAVTQLLGIAGRDAVANISQAVIAHDGHRVVEILAGAAEQGADALHLAKQLLGFTRDLVVLKVGGEQTQFVELTPDERQIASTLANETDMLELQRLFTAVSRIIEDMSRAAAPQMVLEMGLVRLATQPSLQAIGDVLSELEKRGGSPRPQQAARAASSPAEPAPPKSTEPAQASQPVQASRPEQASQPAQASNEPQQVAQAAEVHPERRDQPKTVPGIPSPIRRAALQEWEHLIDLIREQAPALGAVLEHGVPRLVSADEIVIAFKEGSFHGRQAEAPESIEVIQIAAERHWGQRPTIEIRKDADTNGGSSVAAVSAQRREAELEARRKEAENHPRVRDAMEIFPGTAGTMNVQIESE